MPCARARRTRNRAGGALSRRALIVRRLSILTLLTSCLGFVSGVIHSCIGVAGNDFRLTKEVVIGFGESLVNIGFRLVLLTAAALAATNAAFRSRPKGSELVDPHA